MTAKSISSEPRSRKPDLPSDIEERIRQRAYELYRQRGKADEIRLGQLFPGGIRNSWNGEARSCDDVDFAVTPATNVLFTASMITSVDPGRNECHKDFVVENVPSRHIYGISMVLHVVATNTT